MRHSARRCSTGSANREARPGPPLLIIAGAGCGKTNTLAHRVAHLLLHGADPERVLLLTFTRRAAQEMTRRAQHICAAACSPARAQQIRWAGTFHSIGNRLLRLYAESIGLVPSFTVLDRADSEDLMNLLRDELGFSRQSRRFPKKGTCFAIYSYVTNTQRPLREALATTFPWCAMWADALRALFHAYVAGKQARNVLDYDDLLLYWQAMMADAGWPQRCARASITSWSTSIRTPTRCKRRSCSGSSPTGAASRSSVTRPSRSTPFAPPRSATSSISPPSSIRRPP